MKVLISSDLGYPYTGGAETAVINTAKGMLERGHDVTWFMSRINSCKRQDNYKGINIRRVFMPFPKNYFLTRKFYPITSFLPLLKHAKKCDIMQFCSFIGALNGPLVSKITGKPYLCQTWELFGSLWKRLTKNWLVYQTIERYIANSYPFYIAISEYTKRKLMSYGTPKDRIFVNYLAVDHDNIYPSEPKFKTKKKYNIGWCGRMKCALSKNLPTLLKSFKLVQKETDAVLLLAGTGFDALYPLIRKEGLKVGKDVIYLGRLPDEEMKSFYSSLDCYALPSFSEGFGLVALEAQACGTPVTSFNVGSLPEVVKGKLIETQTPEAFSEGIIDTLLRDTNKSKLIKHAKKFTWERTVKNQLKIYENVINNA